MGIGDFKFRLSRKFEQRGEEAPEYKEIDEVIETANKLFMDILSKKEKRLFSREIEKVQELCETANRIYKTEKDKADICFELPTYEAVFRHLRNLTFNKIYFLRKIKDIILTITDEAGKLDDYEKKIDRFERIKGVKRAREERIRISGVFERFLSLMDDIRDQEDEIKAALRKIRNYTKDMIDILYGEKRFRQKAIGPSGEKIPAYTLPELIRYVRDWYAPSSEAEKATRGYLEIWDDFRAIKTKMNELRHILIKEMISFRHVKSRISRLKRKEGKIVKITGRKVRKAKRRMAT